MFPGVKVKAGGQVVSAGEAPVPLALLPEPSWAPLACVLVYCVHPTGEIVNDLIWLPISPILTNKVNSTRLRFTTDLRSEESKGKLPLDSRSLICRFR